MSLLYLAIADTQGGAGGLILAWINETSEDTETRAILVAWANDLAYIMQCIGPLFYWKTT